MRVLLDENLPHALRKYLSGQETVTAAYAGLAGLKNGEILDAVEQAGFDVLVTGDKTLEYEQNFRRRKLALVCLSANAWRVIRAYTAEYRSGGGSRNTGVDFPRELWQVREAARRTTRPTI